MPPLRRRDDHRRPRPGVSLLADASAPTLCGRVPWPPGMMQGKTLIHLHCAATTCVAWPLGSGLCLRITSPSWVVAGHLPVPIGQGRRLDSSRDSNASVCHRPATHWRPRATTNTDIYGQSHTSYRDLRIRRSCRTGPARPASNKLSSTAPTDGCTTMDSPGRSYAVDRPRHGGRASLIRQRSVVQVHLGPPT